MYRTGPLVVHLKCDHRPALDLLSSLYPGALASADGDFPDFHISLRRPRTAHRWYRPQIRFFYEDNDLFRPFPLDHAFPLLEWGLNWCIASHSHQYLMLHAGVVERGGKALILPATPGSGKSTLAAGLTFRGWRLLSDEFGLIRPGRDQVVPLPRAIPLKNESIEVIRNFAPEAFLGPLFPKTRKGTVSHLRPPGPSLEQQQHPADPSWIVFPRYRQGAGAELKPIPDSLAFVRLSGNSFNYRLLGETGFRTLAALIRKCDCFSFEYGDLEAGTALLGKLSDD